MGPRPLKEKTTRTGRFFLHEPNSRNRQSALPVPASAKGCGAPMSLRSGAVDFLAAR